MVYDELYNVLQKLTQANGYTLTLSDERHETVSVLLKHGFIKALTEPVAPASHPDKYYITPAGELAVGLVEHFA